MSVLRSEIATKEEKKKRAPRKKKEETSDFLNQEQPKRRRRTTKPQQKPKEEPQPENCLNAQSVNFAKCLALLDPDVEHFETWKRIREIMSDNDCQCYEHVSYNNKKKCICVLGQLEQDMKNTILCYLTKTEKELKDTQSRLLQKKIDDKSYTYTPSESHILHLQDGNAQDGFMNRFRRGHASDLYKQIYDYVAKKRNDT